MMQFSTNNTVTYVEEKMEKAFKYLILFHIDVV